MTSVEILLVNERKIFFSPSCCIACFKELKEKINAAEDKKNLRYLKPNSLAKILIMLFSTSPETISKRKPAEANS